MPQKYSKPVYEKDVPWWAYDLAIAAGSVLLLWAAFVWTRLALIPLALLWWGSFIEPRLLVVKRFAVGRGERTLRIAFLSDIHVGPYKGEAWMRKLVRRTNALEPDLILLGGDLITRDAEEAASLAPMRGFRAKRGVFAILGNHDWWKGERVAGAVKAELAEAGIPTLLNRAVRLEHDGAWVAVAGVEDDWYADTDFAKALAEVRPGDALVMMIHNPDLAEPASKFAPKLMLSGHVHGGQIRLPLWGPVPKLPHHLDRKYDKGLFDWNGVPYVIGAGTGESGPRARLFCPPEIVVVELRF